MFKRRAVTDGDARPETVVLRIDRRAPPRAKHLRQNAAVTTHPREPSEARTPLVGIQTKLVGERPPDRGPATGHTQPKPSPGASPPDATPGTTEHRPVFASSVTTDSAAHCPPLRHRTAHRAEPLLPARCAGAAAAHLVELGALLGDLGSASCGFSSRSARAASSPGRHRDPRRCRSACCCSRFVALRGQLCQRFVRCIGRALGAAFDLLQTVLRSVRENRSSGKRRPYRTCRRSMSTASVFFVRPSPNRPTSPQRVRCWSWRSVPVCSSPRSCVSIEP